MLRKEDSNPYKMYARKVGRRPKDIEQWLKEKKETEERQKQSQQDPPKESADLKEPR